MTTITKTNPMIATWFYFFIRNEGSAIPTLKELLPKNFIIFTFWITVFQTFLFGLLIG